MTLDDLKSLRAGDRVRFAGKSHYRDHSPQEGIVTHVFTDAVRVDFGSWECELGFRPAWEEIEVIPPQIRAAVVEVKRPWWRRFFRSLP